MESASIDGMSTESRWLAELLQQLSDDRQGAGSLENAALLAIARKLAYKNQLHSILTRINEAIVRIREPQALYAEACRIATSAELFRMAWVGLVDPDAGVVRPVAWAGAEDGYLARIRISVGDDPEGQGPSGNAIRKGRHFICEDFETDERMRPWRAEALQRGYRSSAAFPLVLDGKVFGAFTLYASLPRFFDAPVVDLLATLAADISFAVQSAEVERKRREAEERLRQAHDDLEMRVEQRTAALVASERRIAETLASITDCHFALDHDWRFTAVNDQALHFYEMPRQAFLGRSIEDVFPSLRGSLIENHFHQAARERTPATFEYHSLVVDRWAEMHVYPTEEGLSIYFRDITERRRLLDQVQRQAEELEQRVQERTAELASANARLEQHSRHLNVLHEIDRAILSAGAAEAIARVAVDRIRLIVPCRWASVLLFSSGGERVRRLATNEDSPLRRLSDGWVPAQDWRLAPALLAGRSASEEDLQALADPGPIEKAMLVQGVRSYVSVPLMAGGRTIGAMNIVRDDPGRLSADHEEVAGQVADSLAVAIQNARLLQQVQTSRNQLQELSHRLVEAQENERRAIARELHDEAGQSLTGLKLGLGFVMQDPQCPPPLMARIGELRATVDEVMAGLHRMAANLRPASLDRLGLVAALGQFVDTFQRQTGVQVDLVVMGLEGPAERPPGPDASAQRLPSHVETTLYRVVQEALTNVARHAKATRAGVILERRLDHALAIIEDDGIGFDVEAALAHGRLGLVGMRERTEMLGGKITIESSPGSGTTVFAEMPVVEAFPAAD